ncbi:stage II sporulation protein M [Chryseolinea lacunae]|uniref:Stage II sporulation protein M n=1 Tax=Chryseolinea lacunae TaxID=2801331 RepID=A0ABS1KVB9_9BACT|nr:stage II sporulation protein M [Chryseolinea lacunae]MBL0742642.1 stage II sporulation protein M [Chryseolinea lacunae]
MKYIDARDCRYILVGIAFWLLGMMMAYPIDAERHAYFLRPPNHHAKIDSIDFGMLHINGSVFLSIVANNLLIGILVSAGGFLTGGILTAAVFTWNGFILMLTIRALSQCQDESIVELFAFHGIFEISAFLLFGTIGFRGFSFWKNLIEKDPMPPAVFINWKFALLPTLLLVIAATIEYYMIKTNIR